MPKVNSIELTTKLKYKSARNLEYWRIDDLIKESSDQIEIDEYIKLGGVIFSQLTPIQGFLNEEKIDHFKKLLSNSYEFKNACVWKSGIAKKLYLDRVNKKKLKEDELDIFNTLERARELLVETAEKICGKKNILRIEDIVYPSETIGRELHLDRHDKSRKYQDYRSIKLFLNLSSSSCRIWGIGKSRPQLIDKLTDYCNAHSLEMPNFENILDEGFKLPEWMNHFSKEKLINHPISILNSVLNNIFLKIDDANGDFDLVYYNPNFIIIGDSKQVAHKPVYGNLGISIDVVFKEKDIPYGFKKNNIEINSLNKKILNEYNLDKKEDNNSNTKQRFSKNFFNPPKSSANYMHKIKKKIKRILQRF